MFYVFDLDGTLADITHRTHHVRNGKRNWKQFFEECGSDIAIADVCNTLKKLREAGHRVEIWSGRSDEVMLQTIEWLEDVADIYPHTDPKRRGMGVFLQMRKADDYRPDEIIKEEWLKAADVRPDMIFDDRQKVVDMWRRNGITCAQVAPGDFDDPKPKQIRGRNNPILFVMIGPSGAGKSTYAKSQLPGIPVVSTDVIRRNLFGTQNGKIDGAAYTPEGFTKTFSAAHSLVKAHLMAGQSVVYDATNLAAKDRKAVLKNAGIVSGDVHASVEYVIINRPLNEKLESFKSQAHVDHTTEDVIKAHDDKFQGTVPEALRGDGFNFVHVIDARS